MNAQILNTALTAARPVAIATGKAAGQAALYVGQVVVMQTTALAVCAAGGSAVGLVRKKLDARKQARFEKKRQTIVTKTRQAFVTKVAIDAEINRRLQAGELIRVCPV